MTLHKYDPQEAINWMNGYTIFLKFLMMELDLIPAHALPGSLVTSRKTIKQILDQLEEI